jgi:hypothetical protein
MDNHLKIVSWLWIGIATVIVACTITPPGYAAPRLCCGHLARMRRQLLKPMITVVRHSL